MAREILFRGKRVVDGKWAESCCTLGEIHSGTVTYDFDSKTVCRYTGATDKECRKIFEWDIVKENGSIGIVRFGKYGNGYHLGFYVNWINYPHLRNELCYWEGKVKVIGNIFDNPELLKEE